MKKRRIYRPPQLRLDKVEFEYYLLAGSVDNRSSYSSGDSGFSDPSVDGRSGYDSGGSGFGSPSIGDRSGYGSGGEGFYQ